MTTYRRMKKRKADPEQGGVPRAFELPWGKGHVTAEASIETPYNEPTIQLLHFDDGTQALRFCVCHGGDLLEKPLIVDEADLPKLRRAIQQSSELATLLKKLVA